MDNTINDGDVIYMKEKRLILGLAHALVLLMLIIMTVYCLCDSIYLISNAKFEFGHYANDIYVAFMGTIFIFPFIILEIIYSSNKISYVYTKILLGLLTLSVIALYICAFSVTDPLKLL